MYRGEFWFLKRDDGHVVGRLEGEETTGLPEELDDLEIVKDPAIFSVVSACWLKLGFRPCRLTVQGALAHNLPIFQNAALYAANQF